MSDLSELQTLRASAVLAGGAGHDVLRATGNDRVSFLHRITSGKVAGTEPGQGCRTLLLDVRGRVLTSLLVFVRGKSVRLIAPGGQGVETVAGLSKYAIMDDFQIVLEPDLTTLAVLGPHSARALAAVGVPVPPSLLEAPLYAHAEVTSEPFGPLWIAHGRASGTDGLCVAASKTARDGLAQALLDRGTPRLSGEIAEALRVAAMEPKPGNEITPDRFPVEIGLGAAIDHTKGCYVGQETIVRMRDRGIIRKRLVLLRLAGEATPALGDKLVAQDQAAGQITSVGCLPGEKPVALAILAAAIPVGATVRIQHGEGPLSAEVAAESRPWG
jgi:folate-binding protein YgfZ